MMNDNIMVFKNTELITELVIIMLELLAVKKYQQRRKREVLIVKK